MSFFSYFLSCLLFIIIYGPLFGVTFDGYDMALVKCVDPRNEAALRQFALPVELLPRRAQQTGGYRYFQAPNVHPIEHYRLSGRAPAPTGLGRVLPFPKRRPYR
jgi:hypothetical protein